MVTLSIQTDATHDGATTLALTGEIDLGSAATLRDAIPAALSGDRPTTLVLDLDRVTFLDSTGIAALISGKRLADAFGATYRVVNVRDSVRWVLEIAGVLAFLDSEKSPTS